MNRTYLKKIIGTSVFAVALLAVAFSWGSAAFAVKGNNQASATNKAQGHVYGAQTTVCHIPPGNPAQAHTLTVGNAAVQAHLAHGDYVGPCES